ncbi:MAG TPA: monovalent cation/H(+) antiporter subunit G [Micromonosporaceae bacterium]|nr:monovalent cation/H(+) antiporter subunit G [Micromonosporaceae bacterium]
MIILDILSAVLLLAGAAICLLGGIGMVTFPDVMTRLHAASKPQSAGFLLLLLGAAVQLDWWALSLLTLAGMFQLLTSPVVSQVIGRVAYRTGEFRADLLARDETSPDRPP